MSTGSKTSALIRIFMVLVSIYLAFIAIPLTDVILRFMTTDGCGQVLNRNADLQLWLLSRVLYVSLVGALIFEFIRPEAKWSAWGMFAFPLSACLISAIVVGNSEQDFLTECDQLFPGIVLSIQLISFGLVGTIVLAVLRAFGRHRPAQ